MRNGFLFLLSMVLPSVAGAVIVPGHDVTGMTRDADLIIVGTVTSIELQGDTTTIREGGSGIEIPATAAVAMMTVDQVLKGEAVSGRIAVRLYLPHQFAGYGAVSEGDFKVYFLREADGEYRFVSAYTPGITAVPGAQGRGADPFARVLSLLADGLRMGTNPQVKIETLQEIRGIDSPIAIEGLNAASLDSDQTVRIIAVSYLLWLDQLDALPVAEAALADATLDPRLLAYLRHGIERGIRDERAIPVLARLLLFPEAETRRAAARAMRYIESPLIIEPLRQALDDRNAEVRLAAVRGLAMAVGEQSLFPGDDVFHNDEQRFIEPLRSLASTLDR